MNVREAIEKADIIHVDDAVVTRKKLDDNNHYHLSCDGDDTLILDASDLMQEVKGHKHRLLADGTPCILRFFKIVPLE